MVLSTTKKVSSIASISAQSQGGGSKKAGFPYQVGRISWSNVAFNTSNTGKGKCCTLKNMSTLPYTWNVSQSRPIGRNNNVAYWHIPGLGA